jgi:uncharacterized alkaline shock family protein YloU
VSDHMADQPTSNGPGRFAPRPDTPPAASMGEASPGGAPTPATPASSPAPSPSTPAPSPAPSPVTPPPSTSSPAPSPAPSSAPSPAATPGPAHAAGAPAHAAEPAGGPGGASSGPPPFAPSRPQPARQEPVRPAEAARPADVKGRIHIADEVVEKVAALAAIEVPGVADLGGDFERAIESVRERIGLGQKRGDQGVKADVKGHDVAVSVTVMVEYGYVVLDVARQVQANVARKTNRMLGLNVVEVNVTVDDVRTTRPGTDDAPTDAV